MGEAAETDVTPAHGAPMDRLPLGRNAAGSASGQATRRAAREARAWVHGVGDRESGAPQLCVGRAK